MNVIALILSLVFSNMFKYKKINLKVDSNLNFSNINYINSVDFIQNNVWSLTIPSINMYDIEIKDGVDNFILENYIGHFPITSMYSGNICLAAHNAGFNNNYFKDINKLEKGDKVYYKIRNNEKVYIVNDIVKIKNNDFSYLDSSESDMLTLITCIFSSPNYRLCVRCIGEGEYNGKNI